MKKILYYLPNFILGGYAIIYIPIWMRLVEKFHISTLFSSSCLVYIFTSIIVLFGAIIVAFCFKYVYGKIERIVYKNENIVS